MSTLCAHSMYLAQLQYANLRPKYLPANGTMIKVRSICSCSRLRSHSSCASSSESSTLLDIEGSESTSSFSEGDISWMIKEDVGVAISLRCEVASAGSGGTSGSGSDRVGGS